MISYLILGAGYGFSAAVQPGPFQAFLISQTLQHGWRRALPIAFAPLVTDGPIILLMVLVLSQIPRELQRMLYIAGGIFILYLAYNAYRNWQYFHQDLPAPDAASDRPLLKAAAMNALSPGPYIYWGLVTGPIMVAGFRENVASGAGFLAGFYVAIVGSLLSLILLFSFARRIGPRVNRAMLGISALALSVFGLYQLWLGLSGAG